MIPDQASGNPSLTLPTPIVGMVFRFIYIGAAADAHNTLIVPPAGVDYEGSLAFYDRGNATSVVVSDNSADDTLRKHRKNFDIVLMASINNEISYIWICNLCNSTDYCLII